MARLTGLVALLLALAVAPAFSADAPSGPAVGLPPPTPSVAVWPLIRPSHPCIPGWSPGADGVCRRHAELEVICDVAPPGCHPVAPAVLPYGLGPYLRPDY